MIDFRSIMPSLSKGRRGGLAIKPGAILQFACESGVPKPGSGEFAAVGLQLRKTRGPPHGCHGPKRFGHRKISSRG